MCLSADGHQSLQEQGVKVLRTHSLALEFELEKHPEHDGIRVKSTDPLGLYISTRDRYAGQYYLYKLGAEFVGRRRLFVEGAGEAYYCGVNLDWDRALAEGSGGILFSPLGTEGVERARKKGEPPPLPNTHLIDQWIDNRRGLVICVACDPCGPLDTWLSDKMHSDKILNF